MKQSLLNRWNLKCAACEYLMNYKPGLLVAQFVHQVLFWGSNLKM